MYAFEQAICLIEWPDRLGDAQPEDALTLVFDHAPDPEARTIDLSWRAGDWADRLAGVFE